MSLFLKATASSDTKGSPCLDCAKGKIAFNKGLKILPNPRREVPVDHQQLRYFEVPIIQSSPVVSEAPPAAAANANPPV